MRGVHLALLLLVAVLCSVLLANAEVSSSLHRLRLRVEGGASKVCRSRTTGEIVECNDDLEPIHPAEDAHNNGEGADNGAGGDEASSAEVDQPYNPPVPPKPLEELKPVHVPEPGPFPLQPGRPLYETGRVYSKEDMGRIAIVAAIQAEYQQQLLKAAEADTLGYTLKHAGEAPEKGTEPVPQNQQRNPMPEGKKPNNLEPNYYAQLTGQEQQLRRAIQGKAKGTLAPIEQLNSSDDIVV